MPSEVIVIAVPHNVAGKDLAEGGGDDGEGPSPLRSISSSSLSLSLSLSLPLSLSLTNFTILTQGLAMGAATFVQGFCASLLLASSLFSGFMVHVFP
jgi:hypothetical protein